MERFVFETTQGQVLEASDEAALMDYARIRGNALRPCVPILIMALGFAAYYLMRGETETIPFTALSAALLCGFFLLPLRRTKNFRASLQASRDQRKNLTNTVRAKPMCFVIEGDGCRMLDGKGEEIQEWNPVWILETRESQRIFWLPIGDTSVLLPKECQTEGTEEALRKWLRRHSKRYRIYNVTDRVRRDFQE